MDAQFTDDVLAKGEYYNIETDEITLQTIVTVYDDNGVPLVVANVEDPDVAVELLQDYFDLEPLDDDDVDAKAQAGGTRFGQAL